MHGFKGERTLMRVHVEEQDKFEGRPVYEAIVELLRRQRFAGATAFRAVEGFGASAHVHGEHTWSARLDVPVIIECIDTDERIQSVLPQLDRMIGGGIVTLERVRVILYRKDLSAEERDEHASMEVTGDWKPDE
jgi:PII-like signaling protein